MFELDFTNIKAPFGFYRVQLTAASAKPDSKLVGLKGAVEFKVVTAVTIDAVDLGVSDKDATDAKTNRLVDQTLDDSLCRVQLRLTTVHDI